MSRRVSWLVGVVAAVLIASVSPGMPAHADPPNPSDADLAQSQADVKAAAEEVGTITAELASTEGELAAARERTSIMVERYNRAVAERAVAQTALAKADAAAKAAEAAVQRGREQLAGTVRQAYQTGGSLGAMNALLSGENSNSLLERIELSDILARRQSERVREFSQIYVGQVNARSTAKAAFAARDKAAAEAEDARTAALAEIAARQAQLQQVIAKRATLETRLAAARQQATVLSTARQKAEAEAERKRQEELRRQREREEQQRLAALREAQEQAEQQAEQQAQEQTQEPAQEEPAPQPQAKPEGNGDGTEIVRLALSQLGKPYVWASSNPRVGFDCSGLVLWAYAKFGIELPHAASLQAGYGHPVSRSELLPGDLVFWSYDGSRGSIHHVAIWAGNGRIVEAADFGIPVRVAPMYWGGGYWGAVRLL